MPQTSHLSRALVRHASSFSAACRPAGAAQLPLHPPLRPLLGVLSLSPHLNALEVHLLSRKSHPQGQGALWGEMQQVRHPAAQRRRGSRSLRSSQRSKEPPLSCRPHFSPYYTGLKAVITKIFSIKKRQNSSRTHFPPVTFKEK